MRWIRRGPFTFRVTEAQRGGLGEKKGSRKGRGARCERLARTLGTAAGECRVEPARGALSTVVGHDYLTESYGPPTQVEAGRGGTESAGCDRAATVFRCVHQVKPKLDLVVA